jgi:hypothetical protein
VRFGGITTRFFLPTNRRLILELPTQFLQIPLLSSLLEPYNFLQFDAGLGN